MTARLEPVVEFCRHEHPRLVASLRLYTGDRDLADELAQEALARAYRDWRRVSELHNPAAWTHRVAINLANSSLRRRRYERAARARAASRAHDRHDDPDPTLAAVLRSALAALPQRQREAVVLRFLLDMSVEMTAVHMRCAQGTVRALTAQGIAALRRRAELADLLEVHDG